MQLIRSIVQKYIGRLLGLIAGWIEARWLGVESINRSPLRTQYCRVGNGARLQSPRCVGGVDDIVSSVGGADDIDSDSRHVCNCSNVDYHLMKATEHLVSFQYSMYTSQVTAHLDISPLSLGGLRPTVPVSQRHPFPLHDEHSLKTITTLPSRPSNTTPPMRARCLGA
jgi:hypothetical protein